MKRTAIIFLFWSISASCIQEFSVDYKRCPCAEGWKCCLPETRENVCVLEGGSCPCAGVVCENPPGNECVDGNILWTYEALGECVLGECHYNHSEIVCPEGCEGPSCKNSKWEWRPISTDNAPTSSHYSSAVWMPEYQKMLVVGGMNADSWASVYDPKTDKWESIEDCNVAGYNPGLVWTGEVALIWGERGLYYDPSTGFCGNLPSPPLALGTEGPSAVWNGLEMIVWGGRHSTDTTAGARYIPGNPDPGQGAWTPTSTGAGCPSERGDHATVWTGDRMIVWGGTTPPGAVPTNTGAMYDPDDDTWAPTSTGENCPSPRAFASTAAVWTGEEMIVWAGGAGPGAITPLGDGSVYDPVADSWREISLLGAPSERSLQTAVWTGEEMIVWGGSFNGGLDLLSGGGHYNPSTDSWTPIVAEGAPSGRYGHIAVWTGKEMIIWGGWDENGERGDGAVYSYIPDVYGEIIAIRSSGSGMWSSESTKQVAIYLAYGWLPEECVGVIGLDTPHSGPGITIYDSTNEAGFDDVVTCMTNGTDDYLREGTMFYPSGNGSEGNFNESEFWNKSPDLAGCTITRIRHVISSLTITPDGAGGANVDGEWVWEVWGSCGCDGDVDGDGYLSVNCLGGDDCDDNDDTVYPGAPEVCDGKDNDCNSEIDEDPDGVICDDGHDCTDDFCNSEIGCINDPAPMAGTECRPAVDRCDAVEYCDGTNVDCPADLVAPVTMECRPAAGVCDIADYCDGVNVACPANIVEPASTECRAQAGECDLAENCNGVHVTCPTDAVRPTTEECRAAAGVCDVAENCDGVTVVCPVDAKEPATTVCRASAGSCDIAENCTGSGNNCPADQVRPVTYECRASAGVCDIQENCDGVGVGCPADVYHPNGRPCTDDGLFCTGAEECAAGECLSTGDPCVGAGLVCNETTDICE